MFEFQGILCSYSLKVLRDLNLKNLPPQYYLKRWCNDISDEMVELYKEVVVCEPDPLYLVRYSELSHLSQIIVAQSSRDDQLYAFVKSGFTTLEEKVDSLVIFEQEHYYDTCGDISLKNGPRDPKIKSKIGGKGKNKQTLKIRPPKIKAPTKKRVSP